MKKRFHGAFSMETLSCRAGILACVCPCQPSGAVGGGKRTRIGSMLSTGEVGHSAVTCTKNKDKQTKPRNQTNNNNNKSGSGRQATPIEQSQRQQAVVILADLTLIRRSQDKRDVDLWLELKGCLSQWLQSSSGCLQAV